MDQTVRQDERSWQGTRLVDPPLVRVQVCLAAAE